LAGRSAIEAMAPSQPAQSSATLLPRLFRRIVGAASVSLALSWGVFPIGILQLFAAPGIFLVYLGIISGEREPGRGAIGWILAPWAVLLAAIVLSRLHGDGIFTAGHVLFLGLATIAFLTLRGLPQTELARISTVTGWLVVLSLALNIGLVVVGGRELSSRLPLTTGCVEGFDLCIVSGHTLTGPNYFAMALAPLLLSPAAGRVGRTLALALPLITLTRLATANAAVSLLPGGAAVPVLLLVFGGVALTTGTQGILEMIWTNRLGAIAYYLAGPGLSGDVDFWEQPLDSTIGRVSLELSRQLGDTFAWTILGVGVIVFLLPARTLGWRWIVYAGTMLFLEDSARNFSVVLLAVLLCSRRES
jgi:hypothetical protein